MQRLIPVRSDVNLEHLQAARQAADTPQAQIERLDAIRDIIAAVDRGAPRDDLVRLLRLRLRAERIAGYLDGDADARADKAQQRIRDAAGAIDEALGELAVRRAAQSRAADRRPRKGRSRRTRAGVAA